MTDHRVWTVTALQEASRSARTKAAYRADMEDFRGWCRTEGHSPLPAAPDTVAAYLAARAGTLKPSTLERRLAAIAVAHQDGGYAFDRHAPAITGVLNGYKRAVGTAPAQKDALTVDDLRTVLAHLPKTLQGIRDASLLAFGFAAALRRSELCAIQVHHLMWTSEGVALTIPQAKDDPFGRSFVKGIPFGRNPDCCPVRLLQRWIMAARLDGGAVYRAIDRHGNLGDPLTPQSVALIVKRAVRLAGERTGLTRAEIGALADNVSGHSLRAGFITSAAEAGAAEWAIMQHTGHKRAETLRRYIRQGNLFKNSVVGKVGL